MEPSLPDSTPLQPVHSEKGSPVLLRLGIIAGILLLLVSAYWLFIRPRTQLSLRNAVIGTVIGSDGKDNISFQAIHWMNPKQAQLALKGWTVNVAPLRSRNSRCFHLNKIRRPFEFSKISCQDALAVGNNLVVEYTRLNESNRTLTALAIATYSTPPEDAGTTTPAPVTPVPATSVRPTPSPAPSGQNRYGVMLSSKFSPNTKAAIATDLGVSFVRTADVDVSNWTGSCSDCAAAISRGLTLILTVRNGGGGGVPSTPPSDLAAYQRTLGEVVDKYHPAVLVIENEENSHALFYSGTPDQYHTQLKAGCDAAHQHGTTCANGGLVSSLVALLVGNSFEEQGDHAKALNYLKRTLSPDRYAEYEKNPSDPKIVTAIDEGKRLVSGYRADGADFINFHWYIADTAALSDAASFLREASGLQPMTNEVGQQLNEDPGQVTGVMGKLTELDFPYIVWFSIDINAAGGARALVNPDGSLRPNGVAFLNFVSSHN